MTELRYLRSDVHAACLRAEGLGGADARDLHRLWRGFAVSEDAGAAVAERDLARRDGVGWRITATARRLRDDIEAATNEQMAELLSGVGDGDGDNLLAGLKTLPGEDPRPPDDR